MESSNTPLENAGAYTKAMDDMIKASAMISKQLDAKAANWESLELKLQQNSARAAE